MYQRQRVWRACQACRRKKVKCDGEHPCQSCSRNQVDCVFVEPYSNMRLMDPQYVTNLESRMQVMEKALQLQTPSREGRETVSPSTQNRDNENQDFCMPTAPVQAEELSRADDSLGVPAHVAPSPLTHYTPHPESSGSNILEGLDLDGHDPRQEDNAVSTVNVTRLPESLLQALIDLFYRSIYPIFPIIHRRDFQPQYDRWLSIRRIGGSNDDDGDGFPFLIYALLAVAASVIPEEHAVFHQPGLQFYKWINLGDILYSHANTRCSGWPSQWKAASAVNFVIAQGLGTGRYNVFRQSLII